MAKEIILWSHPRGPNPWKVAIVLEELGLPYKSEFVDFKDLHTPVFEKYNPNGRTPAIHDPNTGITLWESGAIIEYIISEYDKEHKLSFGSSPEKYYAMQYLHFQMSGQGPYFGQAAWFTIAHPEKIASAQERYIKEIGRVTAVLDGLLSDKEYLVGGKCSYADLAFIPWYQLVPFLQTKVTEEQKEMLDLEKKYPHHAKWMKAMLERPAVKKVLAAKAEAMAAAG